VRLPHELEGLDALVIPGGESTAISRLLASSGLHGAIRKAHASGLALLGTCAGLILVSRSTVEDGVELLGLIDVEARRNAFGRQLESFEADLEIPVLGRPDFRAVFIRAPWIESLGSDAEPMAWVDEHIVMARAPRVLVTAFHPELTDDPRVHRYFLEEIAGLETAAETPSGTR